MEKLGSWLALRRYNWVDAFAFSYVSVCFGTGNFLKGMIALIPLFMISFHLESRYRR